MSGLVFPVSGTEKISPNIVFLLTMLEFHMMHPDHTHLPALPGLPSSCAPLPEKPHKSNLCFPIYSMEHGTLPAASPLKRWEMFSLRSSKWLSLSMDEYRASLLWLSGLQCVSFLLQGLICYRSGQSQCCAVWTFSLEICELKKKNLCAVCLVQVLVTVMKKWIKKRHQWKPIFNGLTSDILNVFSLILGTI